MARPDVTGVGIFLLIIAGAGYLAPVGSEGHTIPQLSDICNTGLGQLGQMFSADITKNCREFGLLTLGIYGLGLIGIILIIVGAASRGSKEYEEEDDSLEILRERYAKGEITKEEFEQMKKDLGYSAGDPPAGVTYKYD